MTEKDFKHIREKYAGNCKTKSSNPAILELYGLILYLENVDSDYFALGYASNDVVDVFKKKFTFKEWTELSVDLENWTEYQLELFTIAILGGYHGSNYLILNYSEDVVFHQTETLQNRLELIIRLIDIEKKISSISSRPYFYNDISYFIFEGLDFINDHFEIFIKRDINNFLTIKKIVELLKIEERKDEESLKLIDKIKSHQNK